MKQARDMHWIQLGLFRTILSYGQRLLMTCRAIDERWPTLKRWLTFAVLFMLFWLAGWSRLDPDFGWHLQAGNYIRSHGIPAHDIYTFTARSWAWVDHEWGNDVILSIMYGLGGYALATTLYALVWAVALWLSAPRARLFTLLASAMAIMPYAGLRPIAWTVLLLTLIIRMLRSSRSWAGACLPLIFLMWANLHAGFIAGLAVIAYYALWHRKRPLAGVFMLCVLATCINPYGLRLYGEVARTVLDPALHSQIKEWAYFYIPTDAFLFVILWGTGFWLFERKHWRQWFGLSPVLLLASLSASRNLPLFVISATRELDDYISRVIKMLPRKLDTPRKLVLASLVTCVIAVLGCSIYIAYWPWQSREAGYPMQAVAYLKRHRCPGNLFNSYDYGGYLIWKLPSQPVYIDGRMPTWKPYMDDYETLLANPATHYEQAFAQYHIRCALVAISPLDAKLINVLKSADWYSVVQANGSELLLAPNKPMSGLVVDTSEASLVKLHFH